MELLHLFFILIFGHWVGDFVLQSHWMATNKSKNKWALFLHTTVYTMILTIFFMLGCAAMGIGLDRIFYSTIGFGIITFITHGITDYFTSRVSSRMWASGKIHSFFVVVGFDQLIHMYTVILGMLWVLGGIY